MSKIRLSICIATLNRAAFLGDTLESILTQATDEVEVIIVDGASTDNTAEVVAASLARHGRIRYVRLDQKGGVDADYCRAAALAEGEYIWLFTDDDLLKPGAVAAVLQATREDYSLIIVNAEVRGKDLEVCLQARRVPAAADQAYQPSSPERDQMLADAGEYLSFIGAVVIRNDLWRAREKEKYFGTEFIHVGVIFQAPLPGRTLLMAHPWIVIRFGNAQWVSRGFRIAMFNWPKLIWSFGDFANWAKRKVVAPEPWRSYRHLLYERALGRFAAREYETMLASLMDSPLRRLVTRLIAWLPVRAVNAAACWYARWVLRKVPSIGLYDLEASREARRARQRAAAAGSGA